MLCLLPFFNYRYNISVFPVIRKYFTFFKKIENCEKRLNYNVAGHFQHASNDDVMTMSFVRIKFTDDSEFSRELNVYQVLIRNEVS